VERDEYDELLRSLVRIAVHQDTINDDLRASIRQQTAFNADVKTTLARVETLLARMIERSANGRDA